MITDGLGNVTMSKDEFEAFCNERRERAAVAIYAAMFANPVIGRNAEVDVAVAEATILIGRLYRRDSNLG